jgi:Chaperone of endosialidase
MAGAPTGTDPRSGTYQGSNPFSDNSTINSLPYGDKIGSLLDPGNIFAPHAADLSGLHAATGQAGADASAFGDERLGVNQQQQQTRQQQLQAIQALQGAAAGTGPSAADIQAEQSRQANLANQLGLAAANRGHSVGGTMASVGQNVAAINSQAAAEGASRRAQEQLAARGQLVQALGGVAGQDITRGQNLLGAQVTSKGQQIQGETGAAQASAQNAAAQNNFMGGIIGGGASAIGALSDERVKHDIRGADADANEMLDKLAAKTFAYDKPFNRDPRAFGGHGLGVMAQDMERSPMGREVVIETSPKQLDVPRTLEAALAGLAALNHRVRGLEARR